MNTKYIVRSLLLSAVVGLTGCAHNYKPWYPSELSATNITGVKCGPAKIQSIAPFSMAVISNALPKYDFARPISIQEWDKATRGENAYALYSTMRIRAADTNSVDRTSTNDVSIDLSGYNFVASNNFRVLKSHYENEWNAISDATGNTNSKYVGLALSGGGIRSASFCTGVLQGLEEIGVLDKVGYLSTVSGGGYAASWFMLHDDADLLSPGSPHLYSLAQSGNYLNSKHYSKNFLSLAGNVTMHFALIPFLYWPSEYLFSFELDHPGFKYVYRKRLAEAFQYRKPLPLTGELTSKSMADCLPSGSNKKPFWIINFHLALSDDNGLYRNRSGDGFELTPLRAGADAVGYVQVPPTLAGSESWMTPRFGVAASGAAADSNSLKAGATGNFFLRAFNFNLGWHIDNLNGWNDGVFLKSVWYWTTSPFPFYYLGGYRGRTVNSKRSYLSDGGHFENLGLYALVRRGCRLIIVADASLDPKVSDWSNLTNADRALAFNDLRKAELKIKSDFGADVKMRWDDFRETIPLDSRFGGIGGATVFTGEIKNLPVGSKQGGMNDSVRIIYIKAAYSFGDHLLKSGTYIDAEKAANNSFSHDSTVKQFYSEQKVVAYREIARRAIHAAENRHHYFSQGFDWADRLYP